MAQIKNDVDNFFLKNKEKYDVIETFKEKLVYLSSETYQDTINYIQTNQKIFFKDHANSSFFFFNVALSAEYNFKTMELFLDIFTHFKNDLKNTGVTENEMIMRLNHFPNAINYLFSKNFFSIKSIIDCSFLRNTIFINFLPEIEEYDPEYAAKRSAMLQCEARAEDIKFYNFVKNNRQSHLFYRNLNYHPLPLYTAIREDDIDTFQYLISQNNYNLNTKIEFSEYERARTIEQQLTLIKIAAIYGSIKIFKYLWMQDDTNIDDDLILFAYFGRNFDIIHLCEQKCHDPNTCSQPILTNRQDLLDYYLENYADEIGESYFEIECKQDIFYEEEQYKDLNYYSIESSLFSFKLDIIKKCLPRMIFINRNSNIKSLNEESCILTRTCSDYHLFKFLYKYWRPKQSNDSYIHLVENCINRMALESFKLCYNALTSKLDLDDIFMLSLQNDHAITNYLLDVKIKMKFFDVSMAIQYYDEDLFVRFFKMNLINKFNIDYTVITMTKYLSEKMICSLINRLDFLPLDLIKKMTKCLMKNGH